jgi:predicted deacylase
MSKEVLKVGWLASKSGQKCFGINEFPAEGRPYRLPTWLINGSADGPTLVVTAGVHGAEYASIAAALDLGQSLDPKDLRGQVIVAPVMNMPSFRARSIYVSHSTAKISTGSSQGVHSAPPLSKSPIGCSVR